MAEGLKVGDVVRLKSGGPDMTVAWFDNKSNRADAEPVVCVWFTGSGRFGRARFAEASLVKSQDGPGGEPARPPAT
jgi:uncharacterized protein YodC (DUF2158 family)